MTTCLVTGGGGFVGKALSKELKARGCEVHVLGRKAYPDLEALGIHCHIADLSDPNCSLVSRLHGIEAVFHVAAKVDMWGKRADFVAANYEGTLRLLEACKKSAVKYFIYTSSPSVVANGKDLSGIDESQPYPEHFEAYYPETKAAAEKKVLAAHSNAGMRTLSLRPHLIFGPGDTHFVPTILARARVGRLLQVGSGVNKVDVCYIEDCVRAHVLALEALCTNDKAGGRAYFISQAEPVLLWDWIAEVLQRNGLPPIKRKVGKRLALFLAGILESVARIIPGYKPLFTKFLVSEMTTEHYFDLRAAKELLKFEPQFSVKEALDKTFPSGTAS